MNESILLHHEHGLNPTIPVCFYCGSERNEVALLGAGFRGEAPKNMVVDLCRAIAAKKNMPNLHFWLR